MVTIKDSLLPSYIPFKELSSNKTYTANTKAFCWGVTQAVGSHFYDKIPLIFVENFPVASYLLGISRSGMALGKLIVSLKQPKEKRNLGEIANCVNQVVINGALIANLFTSDPWVKLLIALGVLPMSVQKIIQGGKGFYQEVRSSNRNFEVLGQRAAEMVLGANRVFRAGKIIHQHVYDEPFVSRDEILRKRIIETPAQELDRKCETVFNQLKTTKKSFSDELLFITDKEGNQVFENSEQFLKSQHACELLQGELDLVWGIQKAIGQCQTISQNYSAHEFTRLNNAKIGMTSFYNVEQALQAVDPEMTRDQIFDFTLGGNGECEKNPDEDGCVVFSELMRKNASIIADLYQLRSGPKEENRWFKDTQVFWNHLIHGMEKAISDWVFAGVDHMTKLTEKHIEVLKQLKENLDCQNCNENELLFKIYETALTQSQLSSLKEYYESFKEPANKSDVPVVILYPRSDYNGGFNVDFPAAAVIEKQHEKVYKAFVGSVDEMCSELALAKEKLGKLPGVLLIQGHGTPFSLQLGSHERLVSGETDFPEGCLEDNLAKNATIILTSCSAGKSMWSGFPSIAEWIAGQVPGRRVIAATINTYSLLYRYNYNFETNTPEFSYNDGEDFTAQYSFNAKVVEKPSNFSYFKRTLDTTVRDIADCAWTILSNTW